MTLSIHWVDNSYAIFMKKLLGLIQLPNTKAATILDAIKDVLIRCSTNYSRQRPGIQYCCQYEWHQKWWPIFVKKANKALYVHCLAHSLNLCLKDIINVCDLRTNMCDLRNVWTLSHQRGLPLKKGSLRVKSWGVTQMLCPTGWMVRITSIQSIINQRALEYI